MHVQARRELEGDLPDGRAAPRMVSVPKPGGVRRLAVLGRADRVEYTSVVSRLAPRIEAHLGPEVIANRCLPGPGSSLRLEEWVGARRRFVREVRARRSRRSSALLLADVRECYGSIRADVVCDLVLEMGAHPAEAWALGRLLARFAAHGVPGLPIGPEPSAVLANAVLAGADRAVARSGAAHVRWVDDFVVFAADREQAKMALDGLRGALDRLGLGLADEKTRILNDGRLARGLATRDTGSGPPCRL